MQEINNEEIQKKLSEPFREDEIEWRVTRSFKSQYGNTYAYAFVAPYVESRTIMRRLDSVLGIGNWENEFKEIQNGVLCGIRVHLPNGKSVIKYDGADLTNFESTKGGISNAFKRAAVHLGIGRYLYEIPEVRVEIFPQNSSKKGEKFIDDQKHNIKGTWNCPKLPDSALPNNQVNLGTQNNSKKANKEKKLSEHNINQFILKMENALGLSNKPKLIFRIFNRANDTEIDSLNDIRTADAKQLSAYYKVLKPVHDLEKIRQSNNLEEKEFLSIVQTYVVNLKVKSLHSCFFNVSKEQLDRIQKLARETYAQKQQLAS